MKNNRKDRKKAVIRIVALVLALLMVLGVITSAIFAAYAEEAEPACRMTVTVTGGDTSAFVSQTVTYVNRTGDPLDGVLFQVYGNLFRRESALPYENDVLEDAFPAGYAPAGLLFYQITVDGEDCEWAMQGEDEIFLRVGVTLEPGQACEITFNYYVLTTENSAFLGAGAEDWRFFRFYPAACVYLYGEFQTVAPRDFCDYGWTDCETYDVTVIVPSEYTVAAPGTIQSETDTDGIRTVHTRVENARDLGFLISRKYRAETAPTACGTEVCVYGEGRKDVSRALGYAVKALDYLESRFGAYPAGRLVLAESQCVPDAEAAYGIIAVNRDIFSKKDELEREIAFMTAKQYFGKIVSADPAREIWLTDAVSRYLEYLYIRAEKGEKAFASAIDRELRPALQMTVPGGLSPDAYTSLFQTGYEYEVVLLDRGSAALNELRKLTGFDVFERALAAYYEDAAFGIGTLESFVAAFNAESGRTLDYFIVDTLMNIGDYANEVLEHYE